MPVEDCMEDGSPGKRWGQAGKCYVHDGSEAGMKAAIDKAIKQGLAEGEGKLENGAPSIEYLTAFHRFVTGHPHINGLVKDEIHKRSRGSAGGQAKARKAQEEEIALEDIISHPLDESPIKVTNAAPISGLLTETDDYIDASVVMAKEGVFTGTDNQARLKPYNVLAESAPWWLGTPITNGHIPGEVRPATRRIGQIINVKARPETRDVFGTARFFKKHLNEEELARLRLGTPIDGSIGYKTPIKYETGRFNDADYVGIETGPYILDEYALVNKGACTSQMGCGVFKNSAAVVDESDDVLRLVDGRIRKCPKKLNEANKMAEDIEALKADFTKQLNAANEVITGQAASITALTGKISELTTKLDGLAGEHKTLNESFTAKQTAETTAKDEANKGEFKKSLNAAAATEIDALWTQVKGLNPAEYEAWKITNSAKLLDPKEAKETQGKKNLNATGAAARSAYLEAHNKR